MMRLIFGPFVGEFGWELCYWQAHGRWLKNHIPDIEILVVTFLGRQAFYRDFANFVVFHADETKARFGRQDCYNSTGINRKEYFAYAGRMIEEFRAYGAITTPNHNGRFYIKPETMTLRRFAPLKLLSNFVKLKNVSKKSVMLFPRRRQDNRDWPEGNWMKLISRFLDEGYQLIIAGTKDSSYPVQKDERIINLCREDPLYILDLVLHYLTKVEMAVGSQSALPILALHQGVPTLMWGHEQERHERELNWFNTPCRYVFDEKYDCSAEKVFGEFENYI